MSHKDFDARELNKNVAKEKYPMPNLGYLLYMIAEHVAKRIGRIFFTTLDMTYAYGELSEDTSKPNCRGRRDGNWQIRHRIWRPHNNDIENSEKHGFNLGISNRFAFIDDSLIVPHGTEEEHMTKIKEVPKRLHEANISLKLGKCTFAANSIEWVGYKLTPEGVEPINYWHLRIFWKIGTEKR